MAVQTSDRRRLIVSLPGDVYRTLEAQAAQHERVAAQEASWLLRQLLSGATKQATEHEAAAVQ